MPILTVHLPSGHSSAQKTALLEQSTQAVVQAIQAPIDSVRIVLQEQAEDGSISAGHLGVRQVLCFVHLIEGRSIELKAALIAALSQAASDALGISQDEVRIILQDVPKSDMGVAGGISALAAGR